MLRCEDERIYVSDFYHLAFDDELYFDESLKREMTLVEYRFALKHNNDDEVYSRILKDIALMIAPDSLQDVFIKRSGLMRYEYKRETDRVLREVLDEALIMEQVSKLYHPNIVE